MKEQQTMEERFEDSFIEDDEDGRHFYECGNVDGVLDFPKKETAQAVQQEREKERETITPEKLASIFHDTYESLAPSFGYETREDTKDFDLKSKNGKLMVAVCKFIIDTELKAINQK